MGMGTRWEMVVVEEEEEMMMEVEVEMMAEVEEEEEEEEGVTDLCCPVNQGANLEYDNQDHFGHGQPP